MKYKKIKRVPFSGNSDRNLILRQQFAIKSFREIVGIEFQSDNYSYCTCETPNDESCWQKIIYQGDSSLLETWKRR
jgi:hypothetical protein